MFFETISVSPDCASIGVTANINNMDNKREAPAIYVINVDEYFRAKPSKCDWDRLTLVSPSWASHGVCEGWHDIFTEGRPLFARASQIENGIDAISKPFQKDDQSLILENRVNNEEKVPSDTMTINDDKQSDGKSQIENKK